MSDLERAVYNQYLESRQKDVWIKNDHYKDDSFSSSHVRESLVHKFGEKTALFEISDSYYGPDDYEKVSLQYGGRFLFHGNINTAKQLVEKAIEYSNRNQNGTLYGGVINYLEDEGKAVNALEKILKKRPELLDRQLETAKKAAYVQGVCECVAAISDVDKNSGKMLLSYMNVTKDTAKKYANPETYKTLEQGIFAPQHEQKQEQTHTIRR